MTVKQQNAILPLLFGRIERGISAVVERMEIPPILREQGHPDAAGNPILAVLPSVFQAFGILFHPIFETLRGFMPAVMLEELRNRAFDGGYLARCWITGLVWFGAATGIGMGLFQKKEIR